MNPFRSRGIPWGMGRLRTGRGRLALGIAAGGALGLAYSFASQALGST